MPILRLVSAVAVVLFAVWSGKVQAQTCEAVYQDAVRDLSFTQRDFETLHSVFDHHCKASGEVNSTNIDTSAGFPIEGIPVEFTGNFASNQQKIENFCKLYKEVRFSDERVEIRKSTVVVDALASYNECKKIEKATGIVITHAFSNPDAVAINIKLLGRDSKLRVQGVATKNITCRSSEQAWIFSSGELSETSDFEVTSDFAILCTRTGKAVEGGGTEYDPATITIATNIAPYTIGLPQDKVYSNHLASQATEQIESLEKTVEKLTGSNQELSELAERVKKMTITNHPVILGNAHPGGGGKWFPCDQNMDVATKQLCEGAELSAWKTIGVQSGCGCGCTRLTVTCVNY
ncbi:hypothetical protein [Mesorhizobium sp.]|uniref:hypothetical protein n=1 Tax=Mesorhizobium sp. TaxID=1871066 RepID=UPI000FE81BA9|nr:hypothetical protein [Mesorhizobium sp.]RWQ04063.1 MAG: hypothetical protein EOR89_08200 [Mesorhizobium sp.]RWQ52183.1 MAG: hypothetical protein EOS82_11610 [Mesorhizobium sp.]